MACGDDTNIIMISSWKVPLQALATERRSNFKTASTPGSGVVMKQQKKSLAEEELKQCFDRHRVTLETTARKTEVVAAKSAAAAPEQQHKKRQSMAKEIGWARDKEDMTKFWKERT